MADFYRSNGTSGSLGTFVSLIGKTPKAFGIRLSGTATGGTNLTNELGPEGAFAGVLKAISSNVTVLAYQIENNTTGNVSILVEGGDFLSAANMQAIIRTGGNGAGGYGNSSPLADCGLTLVTDVGFKLATA
jgi:hypothetical protein